MQQRRMTGPSATAWHVGLTLALATVSVSAVAQDLPTEVTYAPAEPEHRTWETLADRLIPVNGFVVHDGASWVGVDTEVYRVDDDGISYVTAGLPERVKLISTPEGVFAWTTTAIYGVSEAGVDPLWDDASALRGVIYSDGALWGLEGSETQTFWRREVTAGPGLGSAEVVLEGITDGYAVFADTEGTYYSTGGDEPRLIFEVTGGAAEQVSTSRFWAAEMVRVDSDHLAVLGGSSSGGWIELLELSTGSWTRRGYAPRGSSHLHLVDEWLYWRTPSAVFRLGLESGAPETVAVGTQPLAIGVDGGAVQWVDSWRGEVAWQAISE